MPSMLLVYPSSYNYPTAWDKVKIKSSQLLLASYLAQFFPVEYADFEISIARPASNVQTKRFERKVREYLATRRFDILALSCWTSLSYKATIAVARIARELYPNCLMVVGGYHPSARPGDFFSKDRIIDYVIRGEGELALRDIAQSFPTAGRPVETKIVDSPTLYPEQFVGINWELSDPIVRDAFPDGVGDLAIYLSRGCPFSCSFCMESLKDHHWRPYSPAAAIEQIQLGAEHNRAYAIAIGDACFGVRPSWRKEFFRRLIDLKPSYWITFETRPEYLDEEDIKLLSQLKVAIEIGLESCSPTMLRIMNKTRTPDKFLASFRKMSRLLNDYGIIHVANLILNHPGETQQTLEESFGFVDEESKINQSSLIWACHDYMHFPGSDIDWRQEFYEQEYGTVFLHPNWWHEDEDILGTSRNIYPSRDLTGERARLWRQMYNERERRLKDCLTDAAFKFGADSFFPRWRDDSRFGTL